MKVAIIGGVAGGASAAARLRRLYENTEIILFEKGEYISFANCGLPYYIGEVIKEKEKLVVQTPEKMKERFNIDVRVCTEVIKILADEKKIIAKNRRTGEEYCESYDKLVLSPGAEPIRPNIPGVDGPAVFTLRNIPDTYRIKDYVDKNKPERAAVVGAGFIGLEMVENLHAMGVQVTVIELADHVIGPLDFEMAAIVHQHLKLKNVELYLGDGVKALHHNSGTVAEAAGGSAAKITVELASGKAVPADMVIMGIGVRPETAIARDAGLKIGPTGGIEVNEYMLTSNPDIYAVGDAVEVKDFVNGNAAVIPLAGPANKQGRIAADNICGLDEKFGGTQGTSIVKVFDIVVAITGNNERQLKKNGTAYEKSFTHPASHASYYPGAIPMSIKLMFSKENGRVLGAQIVGYDGVDKRIDVLATAIRAGMTVYDLEKLELAYAPPFSSAKDPVNLAGFTASNILKGDCDVFHWNELPEIDWNKSVLIDVRTAAEFNLGTVPGAVNIPLDELRQRLGEIPAGKDIYITCQVGLRGYLAVRILLQKGFKNVKNLSGGYRTYQLAVQKQSNEGIIKEIIAEAEPEKKSCCCEASKAECAAGSAAAKKENECRTISVDACGLQCPGPILQVYENIQMMEPGDVLAINATDPGFGSDIKVWCERTGNKLLSVDFRNNKFEAVIEKGSECGEEVKTMGNHDKTMVIFSNDLDRAIASFIIANGAAAMGRKVTLFFTFWGLNILRRPEKVSVVKDMFGTMFGMMMPRGSKKLTLSKMNMGGMGSWMIRFLMRKKNVASLEELIAQAKRNGIRLVACNMSMDIMGIRQEELMDGVEIGGVASFLGAAEESDTTLFI